MKLEALIFDVDGTLADTEKDGHLVAFNLAFKKAGLGWEWSAQLYGDLLAVSGGKERIRYYLKDFNTDFDRPAEFDRFVAELHASKTAYYRQLMEKGAVPLRIGVKRLINEAREYGLRLAIATTTTPANVTALLKNTLGEQSIDWFEVIAAGDMVPAKKPAADIFTYALEYLDLKAEQCLAFEDSENGIKSSLAAGLKTVVTPTNYTKGHDFAGAALILDHFGEPDEPFTVLSGDSFGESHFNLELARKLV